MGFGFRRPTIKSVRQAGGMARSVPKVIEEDEEQKLDEDDNSNSFFQQSIKDDVSQKDDKGVRLTSID